MHLGLRIVGNSAHAQTLVCTLGAMSVASSLQGIGSNAAAVGMGDVNGMQQGLMGGMTPGLGDLLGGTTGGNNGGTTTATTRPATTTATTQPAAGQSGGTTGGQNGSTTGGNDGGGGNQNGGGQGSTPAGRGGYSARYVNNGYGRGVAGLGGGNGAGPVFGGRTLSAPLRPVFARITNMRQARLTIHLGFASLVSAPSNGGGTQQGGNAQNTANRGN